MKIEATCVICVHSTLRALSMRDRDVLACTAREFIHGIRAVIGDGAGIVTLGAAMSAAKPSRRKGVCIVERCARLVEASCKACRASSCQRCTIAAELRDSEDRIHVARDAELASLGMDDQDFDELVDKIVCNLCGEHAPFGHALIEERYGQRDLTSALS